MGAAPQVIPPALPNPVYVDTSLDKLEVNQDIPIQQQPQPQPQPQPRMIEPQPPKEVIRPNYPVNKLESPVVNKVFQPMNIVQQKIPAYNIPIAPAKNIPIAPIQNVAMIPVQQVEMVPIQTVEMVPVKEIIPVQKIEGVAPQIIKENVIHQPGFTDNLI